MTVRCKLGGDACGEFESGFDVARHYREAHPGERSPDAKTIDAKKAKKKRQGPGGLTRGAGIEGADSASTDPAAGAPPATPPGPIESPPDFGDAAVPPTIVAPKKSLRERFGLTRAPSPDRPAVPARRPVKRVSGAEVLQSAWHIVGLGAARVDPPVGRCLQYQAPVAGEILDKWLAGGAIDRGIIQPIASRAGDAQAVGALVALPALIYIYERAQDDVRVMLEPWIEEAVRAHIVAMGPVMRKRALREKELQKITDEMRADGLLDETIASPDMAVRLIIESMFAPTVDEAAAAQAATNGQVVPEEVPV